ncbi:MAG: hypothetical protein IPK60_14435 [Sandaracinaceae bacterium]|jgi:hypothetical protein|nr:hypothetical protein [Sandaracinaceae bacterium]
MAANEITCPMCGFSNAPNTVRCVSCGAKIDALANEYTDEERNARSRQQETFDWKWAFISFGVFLVLQAIVLIALPMVINTFDPQGLAGLGIAVGVWSVGGVLIGVVSPGRTVFEPAVGALIAAVPTIAYLMVVTPDAFNPSLPAYIVGGLIGVMISLFGAFIGEKFTSQKSSTSAKA